MPRTGNKLGSSSNFSFYILGIKDICFCKKVYSHKNKEENLKKINSCDSSFCELKVVKGITQNKLFLLSLVRGAKRKLEMKGEI